MTPRFQGRLLIVILTVIVEAALLINGSKPSCPSSNEEPTYLPHENCSKFYICDNGHWMELECSQFLYFNPELNVCDYPRNVPECVEGTRKPDYTLPTTALPPSSSPEPTSPSPSPTTEAPTTPIPTTTTTEKITELPSTIPPTTEPPPTEHPTIITTSLPNGCPPVGVDKIPHSSSCDLYYICVNGRLNEVHCVAGLQFNPLKKECDIPQNSNCTMTSKPPTTTTEMVTTTTTTTTMRTSTTVTTTTPAPNPELPLPECPDEGVSFHPIPGNCSWYVICAEGYPVLQKCADGTCYDENTSRCEVSTDLNDYDAICMNHTEKTYLFPMHNDCNVYHICNDGVYKGKNICKDDKYFQYDIQTCIEKQSSSCISGN